MWRASHGKSNSPPRPRSAWSRSAARKRWSTASASSPSCAPTADQMSPDYAGADVVPGQHLRLSRFGQGGKPRCDRRGDRRERRGDRPPAASAREAEMIRARFPQVLAITGAAQYEDVVGAVHVAAPIPPFRLFEPGAEAGLKLTPRHYSYVKISEGCNHRCAFASSPACAATWSAAAPTRSCARPRNWSRRGRRNCW